MNLVHEQDTSHNVSAARWSGALPYVIGFTVLILGLFYYWFAIANRYIVFLYTHLGAGPFDAVTTSRYWMAGLVASGVVGLLWVGMGLLARRRGTNLPDWWRVWLEALPLVGPGVLAITTTANWPTLPLANGVQCAVAAAAGLGLVLWSGERLLRRPGDAPWLLAFGAGLVPTLTFLQAVELPARGVGPGAPGVYVLAVAAALAGQLLLMVTAAVAARRGRPVMAAVDILGLGLSLAYVGMPLIHYVQNFYLSTGANFFAGNPWLQGGIVLLAGIQALTVGPMQRLFLRLDK